MSEDCLRRIVAVLRKSAQDTWLNEQAVRSVLDMKDDGTRGLWEALDILTSRGYLRTRRVGDEQQWMINQGEPSWAKGRPQVTRDERGPTQHYEQWATKMMAEILDAVREGMGAARGGCMEDASNALGRAMGKVSAINAMEDELGMDFVFQAFAHPRKRRGREADDAD